MLLASSAFAAPTGLDALDDEKLYNELAARGLDGLLDRAFDANKVPEAQRRGLRVRIGLLRLKDQQPPDLLAARRAVAAYVDALPQVLPALADPAALVGDANVLIDRGIAADQTVLEYFGPSAGAMTRLRPVAAAARDLLARAETKADAVCKAAVDHWPAMEKAWDAANEQKLIAAYTRAIVAYPLALATGRADPTREKTLADALATLEAFDTDDNPERASVKFYAAKLQLARATPESLELAADGFAFAIAKGRKDDVRQQFDARLLTISVRLAQNDLAAADLAADEFIRWSRNAGPGAGLGADVLDVAVAGIRFRQAVANGKPAIADDVLDQLQQKRGDLRGLVLELIAGRQDDATPAARLKSLALQARVARAETETLLPPGRPFDHAVIERGIDAARETLRRRELPPNRLDDTAFVLGYCLNKLDRPAEAAAAFLDYVETYKNAGKTERLTSAFDQSVAIVGALYRRSPDDADVTKLYDRTLAVAVAPPLSRLEFAYEYARRQQAAGHAEAAVAAFRQVPANDRNYGDSRYFLMVAVRQQVDKLAAGDPKRPAMLAELGGLLDSVMATAAERLKNPPDPRTAAVDRTRLANGKLFAADLALREQKDAAKAAGVLNDFESAAGGLPNEADLLGEALLIRVQAYVQLGDTDKATGQLVTLAKQNPLNAGQVVYNLLKKLDDQATAAEAAGRSDEVGRLERNRATLTPFLVEWAENHPDPRIKKLTYSYRVADADTQWRAAERTTDAAQKKALLDTALRRFTELNDAKYRDAYLDTLSPEARASATYNPQIRLGLARTYFSQGDYKNARLQLATLFTDRLLGSGYVTVPDAAGTFESRENASYWEALYKLIRSNVALGENVDAMKGLLKEQFLIYGDGTGGRRWANDYAALAKELGVTAPAATAVTP